MCNLHIATDGWYRCVQRCVALVFFFVTFIISILTMISTVIGTIGLWRGVHTMNLSVMTPYLYVSVLI